MCCNYFLLACEFFYYSFFMKISFQISFVQFIIFIWLVSFDLGLIFYKVNLFVVSICIHTLLCSHLHPSQHLISTLMLLFLPGNKVLNFEISSKKSAFSLRSFIVLLTHLKLHSLWNGFLHVVWVDIPSMIQYLSFRFMCSLYFMKGSWWHKKKTLFSTTVFHTMLYFKTLFFFPEIRFISYVVLQQFIKETGETTSQSILKEQWQLKLMIDW